MQPKPLSITAAIRELARALLAEGEQLHRDGGEVGDTFADRKAWVLDQTQQRIGNRVQEAVAELTENDL